MGLNKKGIRLLADDLVAHKKLYNQNVEGRPDPCGTVGCLAGFCLARKLGRREYIKRVESSFIGVEAHQSGRDQLGLPEPNIGRLQIFDFLWSWPQDLQDLYKSNGPRCRMIAALYALQRLREDGTIDPDPKAVHTRLPQLKKLLAQKVKKAA